MTNIIRAISLCLVCSSAVVTHAAEWPQWRGPNQGHSSAKNLPTTWSEDENVVWKADVPGKGWSTPVISGDEIWMTTAITSKASDEEAKERLASNTGSQPLDVVNNLSMRAICVDRKTGKLLSNIELMTKAKPDPVHTLNSYASPSPIIEGSKLYCHFGTNGTACLDTELGEVVWTNQQQIISHENGPGSTPILWGEYLIIHYDGSDLQYIAALNKKTGEVAWKTDRSGELNPNPQLKKSYATPLMINVGGKDQIFSPGANWAYGYDPATGKELWKVSFEVLGFSIVPQPVAAGKRVYMSTSFMKPELLAFDFSKGANSPEIVWRFKKQVPSMPSPILVGGRIYFVGDKGGVITCLDAESGEVQWQNRLGGNYSSSPMYADGKLYICSREGICSVVETGEKFRRVAQNQLDGTLMASPVAIGKSLFLRTDKSLYRIESN